MPWGQEIMVFAQNVGVEVLRPGTKVTLSWLPAHTFGLDAAQDALAGADIEGEETAPSVSVAS
jgi:spermidine/putrescine transport system ATP-binding protein